MKTVRLILLSGFIFIGLNAYCQSVTGLVSAIDSFAVRMPAEKLYLHIDKPYYNNTDTIWLKAYLLTGGLEGPAQSGLLYTELVNDTGRVVLRQAMPVLAGISWGQVALDSNVVPEGSYTLRAYTNWMQNLGTDGFFTRPLYIGKADAGGWLVKANSKTAIKAGRENTEMALQLLGEDGDPVRLQDLQLRLKDGNKTLLRDKMQTDVEGKLRFNFDVPPKVGRLTLIAEEKSSRRSGNKTVVVPLNLGREASTDVQFLPEGGSLIAGLPSKIGFKAIGEDGKGVDIRGAVVDSRGGEVAAFQSMHKGIGSFTFTPGGNEIYTAKVILPTGITKSYPLPVIKPSGMVLTVNNIPGRDSIMVVVQATADIVNTSGNYSLIGQNGGKVCYASSVSFKNGSNVINGKVAKSKFPTGVARFTLFSSAGQPIAERIIFIDHHDRLNISIATDKQNYQPTDSVSLNIKVTDKKNNPIQGSFSLAVTDDSAVKPDSTNVPNINNYMLLQSELKGNIEEPGYYFNKQTPETELSLDNLLLTQGWVAYNWQQVFDKPAEPKYRIEKDFEITGTIKRLSKPQAGLTVTLLSSQKPVLFRDTVTDALGRFRFSDFPKIDTPAFMIKVKDKKGKIFEANVEVDEFTPAAVPLLPYAGITPWYVNSDTTQLNNNRQNISLQKETGKINNSGATQLQEVVIRAKKIVKGSKNLNGPGNADQVLDEQDMIKLGKMSLYDLLLKKIKGFGKRTLPTPPGAPPISYYGINEKQIKFVFDGIDLDYFFNPINPDRFRDFEHFTYVSNTIALYSAEDIKGIEVMYGRNYSGKYTGQYESQSFVDPLCLYCANPVPPKFTSPKYTTLAYVEITTWSGNGLFQKRKRGAYVYRPMPVSWPKEFYTPKYTAKPNKVFDLQSTVYWQPSIFTDEKGMAKVSFYTKSTNAGYSIILQGVDMNGTTGYHKSRVVVKDVNKSK